MLRYTRPIAALLFVPFWLAACSFAANSPSGSTGGGQPGRSGGRGTGGAVPVVTARVEQKPMPVALAAVGTVEAISSVQIRAQVTGQLSAIHFAEGQDIQAGQPLFSLDSRPFQATLQQAEAVLARDSATLQNAQIQQARNETLFQRGLLPRDQYDSQRAGASASAATVAADRAAIESARLNVQYAEIKAPISGRTGALSAHVGDLVRANDTNALVVINQLSPVYVTFSVPGRHLSDIRRYQAQQPLSVSVIGPAEAGATMSNAEARGGASPLPARGVLSFIDNAMDSTTGMIRLKGTFPNHDRQLWPGAFVQVSIQLTTDSDALVMPATAVQVSQDGQYAYVVKADRTVEMRAIRIERQQGGQVVIADGLAAGDTVVTDGQLRLTPGASVSERGESTGGRGPGGRAGAAQTTDRGGQPSGR